MIDYEALYKQETGRDAMDYDECSRHKSFYYTQRFTEWLIQKFSGRDNLLALAEARFRAAEEYIKTMVDGLNYNFFDKKNAKERLAQSIAAYDKAKEGEIGS